MLAHGVHSSIIQKVKMTQMPYLDTPPWEHCRCEHGGATEAGWRHARMYMG